MIRKKINRFTNPPKVYAGITVDSGAIVRQTYDVVAGTYYPDRSLVPLVLTPVIGYNDIDTGKVIENAAAELIDGHWYRIDAKDGKKEITNSGNIDVTTGSATYGRLEFGENVSADNPVTLMFEARLQLSNDAIAVAATIRLTTVTTQVIPELSFDNNPNALYDPWGDRSDFVIKPVLRPAGYSVTYKWYSLHDGVYGLLGSTRLDWAVSAEGDGVRIKRSVMQDSISLKCVAEVKAGSDGSTITLEEYVRHTRRLPKYEYEIGHIADINTGTTQISPKALIRTSRKMLEDLKDEASIDWYGSGSSPIASGINPRLSLSSLGADMNLGLDVVDKGGYKALVDSDGAFIVDSTGAQIILK